MSAWGREQEWEWGLSEVGTVQGRKTNTPLLVSLLRQVGGPRSFPGQYREKAREQQPLLVGAEDHGTQGALGGPAPGHALVLKPAWSPGFHLDRRCVWDLSLQASRSSAALLWGAPLGKNANPGDHAQS